MNGQLSHAAAIFVGIPAVLAIVLEGRDASAS